MEGWWKEASAPRRVRFSKGGITFLNTTAGIIKNIGETGVALSTLVGLILLNQNLYLAYYIVLQAIAVYTVIGVFSKNVISSMKITLWVLLVIWSFILIIVAIPNATNRNHSFHSPVPVRIILSYLLRCLRNNHLIQYWCWIGKNYVQWRLWGEYVWIWTALLFSLITYIPLYLWMRGNLVLGEEKWWRCSFRRVKEADPTVRNMRRRSLVMLAWVTWSLMSLLGRRQLVRADTRSFTVSSPSPWLLFAGRASQKKSNMVWTRCQQNLILRSLLYLG